jgi:TorA maturation chaperone TorD
VETERTDRLEAERAQLFALLGRLLSAPPDADLLGRLRGLAGNETPLGRAIAGLATAAGATGAAAVEREYFALFIGVGRGELMPYASWYLTGFLHDRPLAELRAELRRLGVQRAPGVAEPEDHIAFECEVLSGLFAGSFPGAAGGEAAAGEFFARHLRPWAGRFFADLEGAEAARFYRAVGALGRTAIEIEQAAAELPGQTGQAPGAWA